MGEVSTPSKTTTATRKGTTHNQSLARGTPVAGSRGVLSRSLLLIVAQRRSPSSLRTMIMDGWEVVQGVATLEVVDEGLDLHAGAGEDQLAAHDLRVARDDHLRGVRLWFLSRSVVVADRAEFCTSYYISVQGRSASRFVRSSAAP